MPNDRWSPKQLADWAPYEPDPEFIADGAFVDREDAYLANMALLEGRVALLESAVNGKLLRDVLASIDKLRADLAAAITLTDTSVPILPSKELYDIAQWVRGGSANYNTDDSVDEIARALENRSRKLAVEGY